MLAFENIFESEMVKQIFGAYGNDILVMATAILVGVTGFYAWQTKKTVESLEKSTRYQFFPFLKAYLGFLGPTHLELIIKNVGKGPAKDVEVDFYVEESPNTRKK
jgi:hypothetical protein